MLHPITLSIKILRKKIEGKKVYNFFDILSVTFSILKSNKIFEKTINLFIKVYLI
jgi:hypothetical protein